MEPKEKEKEKKLLRLDTGSNLFDQLTSVLDQAAPLAGSRGEPSLDPGGQREGGESAEEMLTSLTRRNSGCLLQLGGAVIVVDACSQLQFLAKYHLRYRDALAGTAFILPATLSEALTTRNT